MRQSSVDVQRKKYQKPSVNVYPVDLQGTLLSCSNDDDSMCVVIVPKTHN
ncbi:hypothetical protein [Fibrobacter sp.]|nr:hypothetical protein [Fibrobacter sp.]MBR3070789.1 hypothetical protein [Fibrobacter sp.]